LRKYRPRIVGITGSVGKSSTKQAVFTALAPKFNARSSQKNYNNEFGLPFAVIGVDSPGKNIFKWLAVFIKAMWMSTVRVEFPEVLILEMGVDRIGDMDYLLNIAKPDIAILTAIGVSHLEFFSTPERILEEKIKIFRELGAQGCGIVNIDDKKIRAAIPHIRGKVLGYGFDPAADVRIVDCQVTYGRKQRSFGTMFKVSYKGETAPVFLSGTIGMPHVLACTAAVAVGLNFGMSLKEIAGNLAAYEAQPGRLRLIPGVFQSTIIDDTYNAAPNSTAVAINELAEFPVVHKIAVLGDMLELGKISEQAHKDIGIFLSKQSFDYYIGIGKKIKLAIEQLRAEGVPNDQALYFDKQEQLIKFLEEKVNDGTAVLIKGSQGSRMEKVVKAIMAEPKRARELLCRQDGKWLKN